MHELLGWAGPMTRRQFAAWQQWLVFDLNQPSRADYHVMRAALEIARQWRDKKDAAALALEEFRVSFKEGAPDKPRMVKGPLVVNARGESLLVTKDNIDKFRMSLARQRHLEMVKNAPKPTPSGDVPGQQPRRYRKPPPKKKEQR